MICWRSFIDQHLSSVVHGRWICVQTGCFIYYLSIITLKWYNFKLSVDCAASRCWRCLSVCNVHWWADQFRNTFGFAPLQVQVQVTIKEMIKPERRKHDSPVQRTAFAGDYSCRSKDSSVESSFALNRSVRAMWTNYRRLCFIGNHFPSA